VLENQKDGYRRLSTGGKGGSGGTVGMKTIHKGQQLAFWDRLKLRQKSYLHMVTIWCHLCHLCYLYYLSTTCCIRTCSVTAAAFCGQLVATAIYFSCKDCFHSFLFLPVVPHFRSDHSGQVS
jgi:hypothetical protein